MVHQAGSRLVGRGLPIGNGRMGAMLFGGVDRERIQFNENSLWSGDNNWDGAYDCGDHGFGSYRNFGDLFVEFGSFSAVRVTSPGGQGKGEEITDYRRKLDIATGIHRTTFSRNGVAFTREAFASRPDQVMVFHYTSNKGPGAAALSGRVASHARPAWRQDRRGCQGTLVGRRDAQQAQARLRATCSSFGRTGDGRGRLDGIRRLRQPDAVGRCPHGLCPVVQGRLAGMAPAPVVARELAAAESRSFEALRKATSPTWLPCWAA